MIFSITTFPGRIGIIEPCLRSLMCQRDKDDKIVLWLGEEQFPNRLDDVPWNILKLREEGVEIRFTPDTRSFKKLIPSVEAFPDETVITFDDDVVYHPDVVKRLKKAHLSDPHAVWAHAVSDVYPTKKGWVRTSGAFGLIYAPQPLQLMTGMGGVLYPPHSIDNILFNIAEARRIAPTNDDVWFWYSVAKKGTPIRRVPRPLNKFKGIAEANSYGSLSSINEVHGDAVNRQYIANVFARDPEFAARCKAVAESHRFRILLARMYRVAVYYPWIVVQTIFKPGGVAVVLSEMRRRFQ